MKISNRKYKTVSSLNFILRIYCTYSLKILKLLKDIGGFFKNREMLNPDRRSTTFTINMRKKSGAIFHAIRAISNKIKFNISRKRQITGRPHPTARSNHFRPSSAKLRENDRITTLTCFAISKLATKLGIETKLKITCNFFEIRNF